MHAATGKRPKRGIKGELGRAKQERLPWKIEEKAIMDHRHTRERQGKKVQAEREREVPKIRVKHLELLIFLTSGHQCDFFQRFQKKECRMRCMRLMTKNSFP